MISPLLEKKPDGEYAVRSKAFELSFRMEILSLAAAAMGLISLTVATAAFAGNDILKAINVGHITTEATHGMLVAGITLLGGSVVTHLFAKRARSDEEGHVFAAYNSVIKKQLDELEEHNSIK